MIPDSLFSPPQSPFFFLLRVPFSSSSKSLFLPSPSPVPPLRFPFPSSSLSSSIISKSSPLLPDSRSRPLPSSSSETKKTAERHEAVPPFSWWLV